MATDVGSAVGYLDLDISGFLSGLRSAQSEADAASKNIATKIGNNMQSAGKSLTSAGSTLTKGFTVPLVAAGTAAFNFSADFETAMAKVSTIADPAAKSISDIQKEITNLSNKTGMAASDLAEATYEAISSGINTADAVKFTGEASKLAAAGFTSASSAVDVLTTILNAYGLSAEETTHISDVLIKTQNLGKTTVDELSSSMGKVIPTANAFGVSVEQLGTAYSFMTARGISTAESTTYLNGMLNELGKSGTTVSDTLKEKTGKSFQELMADGYSLRDVLGILQESADEAGVGFNDLWQSQEAGKAALSLAGVEAEKYNSTLKDFQQTVGDTDSAYEKMSDTTEFKLNVALQNGKNALITLGDTIKTMLLPFIEKGVEWLKKLNEWLNSLTDKQKEQIVKIAAVVAAAGPLLMIIGKVVSGVGGMITTFGKIPGAITEIKGGFTALTTGVIHIKEAFVLAKAGMTGFASQTSVLGTALAGITAPIAAIIAVVVALVAAFATLWKTNEEFRNKMTAIWNQIKETVGGFCDGIVERINALGFNFKDITEVLWAIWKGFCDLLAPIFEGVFQNIAIIIKTVLGVITGILDIFIGLFTGNWDQLWTGVKEVFGSIWDGITGLFGVIGNTLKGILDAICGWFGTTWDNTWNAIKQFFADTWNAIVNFFTSIGTTMTTAVSSFITAIINFFAQLPANIANFITSAFNAVVTWASDMVAKAGEMGASFLNAVVEFFTNLPYNVGYFIGNTLANIVIWVGNMVTQAREMGTNFINNVVAFFTQLPGNILQFITSALQNVQAWAINMAAKAGEMGANFINNVVSFFTQLPGNVLQFITSALQNVQTWATNMATQARTMGTNFINNVVSFLTQLPGKVKGFLDSAIENVKTWVTQMGQKGKEAITELINNIVSAATSIPGKMAEIGNNIVQGVWNGITNAASWFTDQVKGFFSGIVDGVKDALGIHSPSTVFEKQIGKWMPAGVAVGFEKAMPAATRDIQTALNDGISSVEANDIEVGADANVTSFADKIKSIYENVAVWFESIDARLAKSVDGMMQSLNMLINAGQVIVNSDGTLGYVGYNGFTPPGTPQPVDSIGGGNDSSGDGDTYNFYSPKAIDEIEAAKQMKKTKRDIAEGF